MEQSKIELIEAYFSYVAGTEPPATFHRWSFLSSVGALLGRQVWFPFGSSNIYPNMFVMFIGDPGTRKSTAVKTATKLLRAAGYASFSAQKTSMEKFLLDLEGEPEEESISYRRKGKGDSAIDILASLNLSTGKDDLGDRIPKEVFVAADEFNNFLGSNSSVFKALLGELWDWDSEDANYSYRLKNSKSVSIYQPTVSILAGNTPSSFAECFPLADIGQGFMSRLVLVHSESSGLKVTFPSAPDPAVTLHLTQQLAMIKQKVLGPISMDSEAESALDLIYKSWIEIDDSRFKHYGTRRFTHLIKLCIIVVSCRLSTKLTVTDVVYANTILAHAESSMPKAIGELGKSKHSEATNKIMQALYTARKALTAQDLWKVVTNDLDKMEDLSVVIMNLQRADKIQAITLPDQKTGYLAKQKPMSRKQPYVNFDILKGKELPL
jgi:hypothetical protein